MMPGAQRLQVVQVVTLESVDVVDLVGWQAAGCASTVTCLALVAVSFENVPP